MAEKNELLQIRVDPALKRAFFKAAEERGISPSGLLRNLMQKTVDEHDVRIEKVESEIRSIHQILAEALRHLQKTALLSENEPDWDNYKSTSLPIYLDEMISQTIRDAGIKGDEYQRQYWRDIDASWFTRFSNNPPFIAMHLKPETMDRIREEIRSSRNDKE